jgi:hypothetical protein
MRLSSDLQDGSAEIAACGRLGTATADGGFRAYRVGGAPSPEATGARQDQPRSLRSATAGRILFSAIKSDLMTFGQYLTQLRGAALAK